MKHHRAKVDFELVEKCRDIHDRTHSPKAAQHWLWEKHNLYVSINTVKDWCFWKTRLYK